MWHRGTNLSRNDCQHGLSAHGHICHNIFLTFHLLTPLTNASLKDENTKFNSRKYKKYNKYIWTLIMNCIGVKLGKKRLKKNSKIQLKI